MKTLGAALSAALTGQSVTYFKRVYLAKRSWNGASYGYDGYADMSGYVREISPVKWKLDWESYGVFRYSNCTLTLKNERNQWRQDNPNGLFPSGKLLAKSKFRIEAGVVLADGTESLQYVFTGFANSGPVYSPEDKTCTLTLTEHLGQFEDFNAEEISTLAEDEVLGSDSGTEFATANNGVGIIASVKKGTTASGAAAATELKADTDYSMAGQNTYGSPVTITLEEALVSGQSLWITYRYWYTDKPIEWIVAAICDLAGVTDRNISAAVFANDAKGNWEQSDAVEFDEGVDEDTVHSSGDVKLSCAFPPAMPTSWTADSVPSGGLYGSYVDGFRFDLGYGKASASTLANLSPAGTWQFRLHDHGMDVYWYFVASTNDSTTANGYCLKIKPYPQGGPNNITVSLYRSDSGVLTLLGSSTVSMIHTEEIYFRISLNSASEFYVFAKNQYEQPYNFGKLGTDGTYSATSGPYAVITAVISGNSLLCAGFRRDGQAATGGFDYFPSGYYTSPVIDSTASFTHWGKLTTSESKPDGTSTLLQYRKSANGSSMWSPWSTVPSSGDISWPVMLEKRYLQLRWTAYSNTAQNQTPVLAEWSVDYYTATVAIPLVNMTGLDCMAALEQLTQLCAYEIGFNAADTFFFRSRASTLSAYAGFDNGSVSRLVSVTDGLDRVYNRIKVAFGEYEKVAGPDSEGDAAPTSRDKYGVRELSISSGNFLPAENVDLAYAIAPTVYAYTAQPRRRVSVATRFALHLELGDKISATFTEDDIFRLWRWGDGGAAYGDTRYVYWNEGYAAGVLTFYGVDMRVEGIEFDLMNWNTTFDLTEVL